MSRVREITDQTAALRDRANEKATRAIRSIERGIKDELAGDYLRGIPNIGGSGKPNRPPVYRAAQVRPEDPSVRLPFARRGESHGRECLVVDRSGDLVMACLDRDGTSVLRRPAKDSDFLRSDLEDVAETVSFLIDEHTKTLEQHAETYRGIIGLAERIEKALEGE